jgi:hypothetical protein
VWVLPAGEGLLEPSVEVAALRLGKRGKKRVVVAIFVRELQKTGRPRTGCRSAPISKSRAGIKPGKCAANWVAAANAKGRWFGVRRRRAVSRLVAKSLAGANSASRRGSRSVDLTPLSGRQSTFAASSRISVGRVCMVPCAPVLGPDRHLRLISAGIIETSGANQEKLWHVVARRKHRRAAGRTKGPADDVPTLGGFVPEVACPDKCAALPRDGPSNGRLHYGRASRGRRIDGPPSRNDRKIYRGVVEPATLVCGILCSTGGTPPSARTTRYFAPFFRCCRISR